MFRLGPKKRFPVQTGFNRFLIRNYRLTQNEISAGLKPLVIKIHPDLFANYPDIQVRAQRTVWTPGNRSSCEDGPNYRQCPLKGRIRKSPDKM